MVISRYYTHVCPVAQFPLLERPFLIPLKALTKYPTYMLGKNVGTYLQFGLYVGISMYG